MNHVFLASCTTDGGTNFVNATEEIVGKQDRNPCAAHKIKNSVDEWRTQPCLAELLAQVDELTADFNARKDLRTLLRSPNFNQTKRTGFARPSETRWSGVYNMLKSTIALWPTLRAIKESGRTQHLLLQAFISNSNLKRVKLVFECLKPLQQLTVALQSRTEIIISNCTYECYNSLKYSCMTVDLYDA